MSRSTSDILTLPYNWEQVQIKPNEFATTDNISASILKLDSNLQYVLTQTQIGTLSICHSTNLFPTSGLSIKEEEYISTFVTNKALAKSLFNHFVIRDRFHSRFVGSLQLNGTILLLNTRYLTPEDGLLFDQTMSVDYFVGINEVVSTAVVNRALKKQFDIGNTLFGYCQIVLT